MSRHSEAAKVVEDLKWLLVKNRKFNKNTLEYFAWEYKILKKNSDDYEVIKIISHREKCLKYYQSSEWTRRLNKVIIRCKGICEKCKKEKYEFVIHLTYVNLFNESLEDLMSICNNCLVDYKKEGNV